MLCSLSLWKWATFLLILFSPVLPFLLFFSSSFPPLSPFSFPPHPSSPAAAFPSSSLLLPGHPLFLLFFLQLCSSTLHGQVSTPHELLDGNKAQGPWPSMVKLRSYGIRMCEVTRQQPHTDAYYTVPSRGHSAYQQDTNGIWDKNIYPRFQYF